MNWQKPTPAILTSTLDELTERLSRESYPVTWNTDLTARRRFYSEDPFGNRLEFIEAMG